MYTEKRKIENIGRVTSAAKKILMMRGVYQAKQQEIAKEAGITARSIQNYFDSKDELILDTILQMMHDEIQIIDNMTKTTQESDLNGYLCMEQYFKTQKVKIIENTLEIVCLSEIELYVCRNQIKASCYDISNAYSRYLEGILRKGREDGSIQNCLDTALTSHMIVSSVWGTQVNAARRLLNKSGKDKKIVTEQEEIAFDLLSHTLLFSIRA